MGASKAVVLKLRCAAESLAGIKTQIATSIEGVRICISNKFRDISNTPMTHTLRIATLKHETWDRAVLSRSRRNTPDFNSIPSCPIGKNRTWSQDELGFICTHA